MPRADDDADALCDRVHRRMARELKKLDAGTVWEIKPPQTMKQKPLFDLKDLLPVLPHRPPFLFVDRVTKLDPHKSIVAERTLRPESRSLPGIFRAGPSCPAC